MHRVVIPHTRSFIAAGGALVAALGVTVFTALLAFDPIIPGAARVGVGAVGGLFVAGLVTIALRLLAARGGLLIDDTRARVGLGVTSLADTWWVEREDVLGVRVMPTRASDGQSIEDWTALLLVRGRPPVVLLSSQDRSTVILIARQIASQAGFPDPDETPAPDLPAAEPGAVRIAVYRGVALSGVLFFFGVSLVAVGTTMLSQVATEPVFGFLFGPLLMFLGVAFVGVTIVKRVAHEELLCDGVYFRHRFRLGRFTWAERSVRAPRPAWRLYVHGLRGAHLELVGEDGVLVMASGTTTRSRWDIARVAAIPDRFARPIDEATAEAADEATVDSVTDAPGGPPTGGD